MVQCFEKTNLYIIENDQCDEYTFNAKSHEDILIKDVTDWTKVAVPFYSWNGCCGVFSFKVHKDYVYVSYNGYIVFIKMYYDGRYDIAINEIDSDVKMIKEIINGPVIQTIRKYTMGVI